MIKTLSKKAGFVLAVTGAAVIGGAATAVVQAAIPSSSDGQIHGCYRNSAGLFDSKGTLRVVDSDASQTCTNQETALNWDPTGSGSYGYATVTQDSAHPSLIGVLDTGHSKGVLDFKSVSCANVYDAEAYDCPRSPDEHLGECFRLTVVPKSISNVYPNNAPQIIGSDPDLIAQANQLCGPDFHADLIGRGPVMAFAFFK